MSAAFKSQLEATTRKQGGLASVRSVSLPAATCRVQATTRLGSFPTVAAVSRQPFLEQQQSSLRRTQHLQHQTSCKATSRPGVFLFGFGDDDDGYDEAYTVMKFQVGIFGDVSKWQRDLNRLSNLYDTDDEGALHAILQETLQMFLRNSEYCGYCNTGGRVLDDPDLAESKFNEVSFGERAKFKEETLSNVDGRTQRKFSSTANADLKDLDQWMCVTLIMAIDRELKLPKIRNVYDFTQAVKVLGGITEDELLAFELLWTPQDEGDSYSKDELLMDYPTMVTLT